jgi:hypothetical protein
MLFIKAVSYAVSTYSKFMRLHPPAILNVPYRRLPLLGRHMEYRRTKRVTHGVRFSLALADQEY